MTRSRVFALFPRRAPKQIIDPIVGLIARTGVTPNHLSLLGFSGNVGAAVLAARGDFLWAGIVMLVFSAMDMLDGALARATGRATRFGAVLDAALDRMSEAALLSGLGYYFAERGQTEETMLCFAALAGSLLVSYVRAHALSQGLDLQDGLFTRVERVILLAVVLMIDQVRVGLWILAVLTMLTGVQRLYVAWDKLPKDALLDEPKEPKT
ncbi:MAG: CDP-alcohol phosphatidyltransferase family protein [Chloroflexi bacterium]|nr:CDP-alcohol phosphatidyltransferase family protein [Chloroflexota bacterium]